MKLGNLESRDRGGGGHRAMPCRVTKALGAKEFGLDPEGNGERNQTRSHSKPCWLLCRAEVGGMPDERRDPCRQGTGCLQEGTGGGSDQGDD